MKVSFHFVQPFSKTLIQWLIVVSIFSFAFQSVAQPFRIGADYYPEHADLNGITKDAVLMELAGFNTVRMGDFAWFNMQPTANKYTLDWLINAVDTLGNHHINTLLCTPTAAIPKWMFDQHPDIMQVTETGLRKPYGKRRNACLNNEVYRKYSQGIATALAKAFKNNPNVIGFQIDNELMAEEPYCYCETCRVKFGAWLQHKYGTIDSLNHAWGLAFWSQTLTNFNQVFLPRKGDNPGCFVDYQEFYSDCTIDFFKLQRDAIKAINPKFIITHNVCSSGFLYKLDLYKLAKYADCLSLDNYPYTWTLENEYAPVDGFEFHPAMASLAMSQIRGTQHKPFYIAEAQISRTAGKQRKMIEPGMVRLWSHQEMAHGASTILYFPYRTFPFAHEQMMNGVLDADNIPRRRYYEVQQTAQELKSIHYKMGKAFPKTQAAIIRDFRCDWAFEDGRVSNDFRYMRHIYSYYKSLKQKGITADVIAPSDNLEAYKLIIVPAQVVIDDTLCKRLETAAKKGATIIITCMSGLKNQSMHSFGRLVNKEIEQLAGIEMQEQFALIKQENISIHYKNVDSSLSGGLWYDVFNPLQTEVLATYTNRFLKDKPALVKNSIGKGTVYYVGTIPNEGLTDILVQEALKQSNITPLVYAENKLVDITELSGDGQYAYIINFSPNPETIHLTAPMVNLLTNETYQLSTTVKGMDFLILKK